MAASLLNEGSKEHNVAEKFFADTTAENDSGYSIEVSAHADGTFTVRHGRNKFEKTYDK